ncbi:MAG: UDP-glucose 4-epimerase GalE [Pseudomonadota bacterium]
MKKSILVTGGAGYIGSHVVKQLGINGEQVIVLDNLCTGFAKAVTYGKLIVGDTGDRDLVMKIMADHEVESVLHFAAHTIVPESVSNPLKYYQNNTASTLNMLHCSQAMGIKHFIFSSTAAVYGNLQSGVATEQTPTAPINPYGTSKLMSEWMLRDLCAASPLRSVILRYFNVAGSDPDGEIGQSTENATLLIKVACEVALKKREKLFVFGTDYPTEDGTGIRDYIHVNDLASAHLAALEYLRSGGNSTTLNCGYGNGYSVRQVIDSVERCYGGKLNVIESPRRAGDPAMLVSNVDAIHRTLEWSPQFNNLDVIVKTSLAWEAKLAEKNA